MLSQAEIDTFVADGYVAVRDALPADVLRACQEEIWSALGDRGVQREDPSTWREPVVRIDCPESEAFAAAGTQPVLWEAFDQLIGEGRWWRRRGVGGTRSTCWTRRRVAQCLEQWPAWPGPHPGFMTRRRTLACSTAAGTPPVTNV